MLNHVQLVKMTEAERFRIDDQMVVKIVKTVAREYWVNERDIYAHKRDNEAVNRARKAVYWMARHLTGIGTSDLGRLFRRDHSSVASGARDYERRTTAHERAVMALACAWYPERYEPQGPIRATEAAE